MRKSRLSHTLMPTHPQHIQYITKFLCKSLSSSFCLSRRFIHQMHKQVTVGGQYQDDCPRQPFIPIYLQGFVAIFFFIYWCNECDMYNVVCYCVTAVFFFCWFIAGIIAIYSIYEPNYNKNTTQADSYCNKTLYLFAFCSTTLTYVLLGLVLLCCCCYKEQKQDVYAPMLLQA
ncbi:transmembrane protein 272-like isoform X4 [Thunnus albacares]|uniref:transmembrane protein 272-like isoform X4 n=1 Tax=Thunnus albacares TaxID=8236 RepID=UPI001CF64BA2|nr:transmembrane protein 272-like isoform X4 [Thunnus albacares]